MAESGSRQPPSAARLRWAARRGLRVQLRSWPALWAWCGLLPLWLWVGGDVAAELTGLQQQAFGLAVQGDGAAALALLRQCQRGLWGRLAPGGVVTCLGLVGLVGLRWRTGRVSSVGVTGVWLAWLRLGLFALVFAVWSAWSRWPVDDAAAGSGASFVGPLFGWGPMLARLWGAGALAHSGVLLLELWYGRRARRRVLRLTEQEQRAQARAQAPDPRMRTRLQTIMRGSGRQ